MQKCQQAQTSHQEEENTGTQKNPEKGESEPGHGQATQEHLCPKRPSELTLWD